MVAVLPHQTDAARGLHCPAHPDPPQVTSCFSGGSALLAVGDSSHSQHSVLIAGHTVRWNLQTCGTSAWWRWLQSLLARVTWRA